jgi:hypothetical protein
VDGLVARLHCRYRVFGDRSAAVRLSRRLDEAVRPRLAAALEAALDQALDGDPSVYVLRRVRSAVALGIGAGTGDDELVRAWGERLAGSVVRTLAADPGGGELVRFEDQSDYVARFVADLVAGCAWERWVYLAFRALRARRREEALLAVLLDHRAELPAILARLERRGVLAAVLAALPPGALTELWLRGLAGRRVEPAAGLRPLFAAALGLAAVLGLPPVGRAAAEALFRDYRERAACAGGADWSEPGELAREVARAFAFLVERGAVEERALAAAAGRIDAAVAPLDWLDRKLLAAALGRLAAPAAPPPAPPRRGLTPRLRRLLEDLAAAARSLAGRLDGAVPDAPANALALAAALFRHAEEWCGEATAVEVIERLLGAWAAIAAAASPRAVLAALERGDPPAARAALGGGETGGRALDRIAGLGAPATAVIAALSAAAATPVAAAAAVARRAAPAAGEAALPAAQGGLETPAAGVFLLLRAAQDLRLAALFEGAGYPAPLSPGPPAAPGPPAMTIGRDHAPLSPEPPGPPSSAGSGGAAAGLLALALRSAGDRGAAPGGPIDRALARLAGLSSPPSRERLAGAFLAASAADRDRFQRRLLAAAAGQRLAEGSALRLFALPAPGGDAVVVQAGEADLWPLGRWCGAGEDRARLAEWIAGALAAFESAFGAPPAAASADAALVGALPDRPGWPPWAVTEPAPDGDPSGDAPAGDRHATARRRLAAALAALDGGRLAPEGPAAADPTAALAASEGGRLAPETPAGADLTVALAATVVLRAWARWLRRFADSSVPFLLHSFVRRGGRLWDQPDGLRVELEPAPLDLVLEMAGYFGALETPSGRTVHFGFRSPR